MSPRPEITAAEKFALGKLMHAYATGGDWYSPAPADPYRITLEDLVGRGWVEKSGAGYRISNYGMNAFYTGKLVRRRA